MRQEGKGGEVHRKRTAEEESNRRRNGGRRRKEETERRRRAKALLLRLCQCQPQRLQPARAQEMAGGGYMSLASTKKNWVAGRTLFAATHQETNYGARHTCAPLHAIDPSKQASFGGSIDLDE